MAQIFGNFLSFLKNATFKVKIALATFEKMDLLFIPTTGHTEFTTSKLNTVGYGPQVVQEEQADTFG